MRFGDVPVGEAEGAVLAHSVRLADGVIRKGTLLSGGDIARLMASGIDRVTVARLDANDVPEDAAAGRLAEAMAGAGLRAAPPFTGRANLYAEAAGLLVVDSDAVDRFNRIDPAITVATLAAYSVVADGQMAATVKIIPFAAPGDALAEAERVGRAALRVAPFRPMKVGLVATMLPTLKPTVMDKTSRLLADRLAPAGATLIAEERVAHEAEAVVDGLRTVLDRGAELAVVFGASATADRLDAVPAGIVDAGGEVVHFGMPVDPGNLLVLGAIGAVPVIGAPGCARSPKENGFDWVLNRLLAEIPVTASDIMGLGVGGLLTEIVSRPQPRAGSSVKPEADRLPRVGVIVLAAGQGRRMAGPNKLTATIGGRPLVRIAVEAALGSKASPVVVVTGNRAEETAATISDLDVRVVHNPDFAEGLSTSLRCGLNAMPLDVDAAIVLLADMPRVDSALIDRLIGSFDPDAGNEIVVPTVDGKRGNPVLWSRRFFDELMAVEGDVGGRHLIGLHGESVVEVAVDAAAVTDVDTPSDLAALGGTVD
ncbi:NTP transferase domain-containing protein [Bauldia sp.]|uniref:NTP transferase domain-containing protein n=1 Tax=Bauldia sp. TaxID=2575872 RepID=UPI003BACD68C